VKKVIEVKNLVKKYGKQSAVDDISFDVYEGEVFGLLGENGAGKSTTLEIIEGLRRATSGNVKVLGLDSRRDQKTIKNKIGVQLQSSAYYNFLKLKEIIQLFCSFYGSDVDSMQLLRMVDLEEKANSYVNSLSGGQKQRFSIVASLVNDPEIVFLDEPTTGLDPLARRNLWHLISEIKQKGKTIVLTTHYMEEAEVLCDRIAIMEKGKILAMDDTHKLIEQSENPFTISFVIEHKVDKKIFAKAVKFGNVENLFGKQNHFVLRIKTKENLNKALPLVQKLNPDSIQVGQATLEDLFIDLTGKTIGE